MDKCVRVWCVAAAGVALAGALFLPPRRVPAPTKGMAPQWRPVAAWSGTGTRTLEVTTGERWRVRCRASEALILVVRREHMASETIYVGPGREREQELGGAGRHWISVEAGGTWEVGVEERR